MASLLLGPKSESLYNDTAAYAFHYLNQNERNGLKMVTDRLAGFITHKYPNYDRNAPRYQPLTRLQRLELEFIKFQDRPVWHRVAIVAFCVIGSPLILAYHSPKLLKNFYISVIDPCARAIGRKMEAVATKVYHNALVPLGRFTQEYLLTPLARAVKCVARFVFHTLPTYTHHYVLQPLAGKVRQICTLANDYLLMPLARGIVRVFEQAIIPLLQGLYTSILAPVGRAVVRGCEILYDRALVPLSNAIRVIARGVFVTFPTKVWQQVIAPASRWVFHSILLPVGQRAKQVAAFLFDQVIVPVAKVLKVVLKGVCVTFPSKIYAHILTPMGRTISRICHFGYDHVLTPIGQAIQKIATAVFDHVIVPVTNGIKFGAIVLHETILAPMGTLIVSLPSLVWRVWSGV